MPAAGPVFGFRGSPNVNLPLGGQSPGESCWAGVALFLPGGSLRGSFPSPTRGNPAVSLAGCRRPPATDEVPNHSNMRTPLSRRKKRPHHPTRIPWRPNSDPSTSPRRPPPVDAFPVPGNLWYMPAPSGGILILISIPILNPSKNWAKGAVSSASIRFPPPQTDYLCKTSWRANRSTHPASNNLGNVPPGKRGNICRLGDGSFALLTYFESVTGSVPSPPRGCPRPGATIEFYSASAQKHLAPKTGVGFRQLQHLPGWRLSARRGIIRDLMV